MLLKLKKLLLKVKINVLVHNLVALFCLYAATLQCFFNINVQIFVMPIKHLENEREKDREREHIAHSHI